MLSTPLSQKWEGQDLLINYIESHQLTIQDKVIYSFLHCLQNYFNHIWILISHVFQVSEYMCTSLPTYALL